MAAKRKKPEKAKYVRTYKKEPDTVIGTVTLTCDVRGGYYDPETFFAKGTVVPIAKAINSNIGPRFRIKDSIVWIGSDDVDKFTKA